MDTVQNKPNKFSDKLLKIISKFAQNRYLKAISNGMSLCVPVTMIGSFFLIVLNFPYDPWMNFIAPYADKLTIPMTFTINCMAIYACIGITSQLCEEYKLDKTATVALSLFAFLISAITPENISDKAAKAANISVAGTVLPLGNFGATGIFTAILISILTVEIVRFCVKHHFVIKMPDGVPPAVANSFASLIPGAIVVILSWTVRVGLGFDLNAFLITLTSPLKIFAGDSLVSVFMATFFIMLAWFFGIHGGLVVANLFSPFWMQNLTANMNAYAAGKPATHIMTESFFNYTFIGGAGTCLALSILMAFFSKSQYCKKIGRFVVIPSIFGISEPITFGVPLILNPYFAIPFFGAPMILGVITYFAMKFFHIYQVAMAPWTLPAPIAALLITGFNWVAPVVAIVNLIIGCLIYYPFFKVFDRKMYTDEQKALQEDQEALQAGQMEKATE